MTVTIPNYFIENNHPSLSQVDDTLYIENTHNTQGKVLVRNTMHGLTFIRHGYKEIQMNGETLTIREKHAILFAQGNYFSNLNSEDYNAITLFFDDRYIMEFLTKYQIDPGAASAATVTLSYTQYPSLCRLVESLLEAHEEKKPSNMSRLKLQAELLLLELHHFYPKKAEAFFRYILQTSHERIRYILEANIDIIHSVEDMHTLLRMSPSHFHKQFIQHFRVSPKKWLDRQRMEKAKFLLTTSDKSVSQVASECGYATASWFIVQFKKYYKKTPSQFRIENRYY